MSMVPVSTRYTINVQVLDEDGTLAIEFDWKVLKVLDFYPTNSNPEVYHFAALVESNTRGSSAP